MKAYRDGNGITIVEDAWPPNPPGSLSYGKTRKLLSGPEFNEAWEADHGNQKAKKGQEPREDKWGQERFI